MFTAEQIESAHAKVKSGADFPNYIQELKGLGILACDVFVLDGHQVYTGPEGYTLDIDPIYPALKIAGTANIETFKANLEIHQQGGTDYLTFCRQAAEAGVKKWTVDLIKMTCIYYDLQNNEVIVEVIPAA